MPKLQTLKIISVLIMALAIFCTYNWTRTKVAVRDLLYLTRPIWDGHQGRPFNTLPHYYTNGLNSTHLCELHGWQRRAQKVQVIDTIIFSIELDLLEIRLKQLWPFVDHFIVLEADRGFTGRPKPLYLNRSLDRFSWAKDKLRYHSYGGLTALMPGEGPWKNEAQMRDILNDIVAKYARNGDAIICSDVDEIPSRQTVRLLKDTDDSWRAHIDIYDHEFNYRHGRLSDTQLADSGWHCSFCFRHISDFVFKMTSYSHNDRVIDEKVLDKNEIQKKICNGEDVYDMYPEVYSFKEMVLKFGAIPESKTMTNLPKHLIQNPGKFIFLLPNGCIREDFNQ
ncbi:unnamed protein product [Oppiella nova]|uniref:Uncharacterized protein n=1 Tax=Oppiella nova TaxID=334625 RepID=A0A7R9M7T8_9ACAR|nr:unnamed protein product [Oppiella nova]CAG2171211.1 unnamed protein product [Oppiella nova]